MSSPYNISNWYWSVQDSSPGTQVYSTAQNAFVPLADATYTAWLALGNTPTVIDTLQNLYGVFNTHNLTSYMSSTQAFPSASADIVLVNPPPNTITVVMTTTGLRLILPRMDTPNGIYIGAPWSISNNGSNAFNLVGNDGTLLSAVAPGSVLGLTLTNNNSRDGTIDIRVLRVGGTSSIAVGSTPVTGGASGNYLYDNLSVLGEKTPVQVTADLSVFTSALKGLAPLSGGGTANFLRADGTWAAPAGGGGGGSPGGTDTMVQFNSAGSFAGDSGFVYGNGHASLGSPGLGTGAVTFNGNTSGAVTVQVQASAGTWVLRLPTSAGSANQFLQTDGAGITSWATPAGGGGVSGGAANQVALYGTATTITAGVALTANQLLVGTAGAPAAATVSGDLTNVAGAFTIAAAAVTYAKMQNTSAASILLGRGSASAGSPQEITLGTNLSMSGTTLNAAAGGSGLTVGTSTIASGTNLRFLYDNGGVLGETSGITFTTTGQMALVAGSVTTNQPVLNITQTWNGSGVVFTGIKSNITPTVSNPASMLIDLQNTSVSKFNVDQSGNVTAGGAINKVTITPPAVGATLTLATGITFNVLASLTLTGSTSANMTFPGAAANLAALNIADQTITGGANVTQLGLTTGSVTIDCGSRPIQSITNNGAYTITAPANDGSCLLTVTNGASAGATTFTGFTVGSNTGDALDTTNAHKFTIFIWRANAISGYRIAAHQ